MDWQERIVSTPDVLKGKPRFKGTRIPVSLILGYLANGASAKRITCLHRRAKPVRLTIVLKEVRASLAREQPAGKSSQPDNSLAKRGVKPYPTYHLTRPGPSKKSPPGRERNGAIRKEFPV